MDKTKGKRNEQPQGGSNLQAPADPPAARDGRVWVRDDGAICIENECVTIQSTENGTVQFTVDPNKCSCQAGDAIQDAILKAALSGRGMNIVMKPKAE